MLHLQNRHKKLKQNKNDHTIAGSQSVSKSVNRSKRGFVLGGLDGFGSTHTYLRILLVYNFHKVKPIAPFYACKYNNSF